MKMVRFVFPALCLLLSAVNSVSADDRYYVWTYDYSTLAKGSAELEYYLTTSMHDRTVSARSDWQHQAELEYGITDHLDAAVYQVFEQPAGENLRYEGFKVRLRYRVAEKNTLPVDVVLYAEHQERTAGENALEGKLILAKDAGKFNIAYNQIYEREYSSGEGESEYSIGASYEVIPELRVGMESKGSYSEGEYAAGPTLAWSGGRIWANIGAVFGLNAKTNDREVRFLVGVPF